MVLAVFHLLLLLFIHYTGNCFDPWRRKFDRSTASCLQREEPRQEENMLSVAQTLLLVNYQPICSPYAYPHIFSWYISRFVPFPYCYHFCIHALPFFFFITISYSVTPVTFTLSIFISSVNPMTDSKLQIHKKPNPRTGEEPLVPTPPLPALNTSGLSSSWKGVAYPCIATS